jgi:hypothetical protein
MTWLSKEDCLGGEPASEGVGKRGWQGEYYRSILNEYSKIR